MMNTPTEPKLEEFFASEAGVCVYVNVGRNAIRVWFESPDDAGSVTPELPGAEKALAVAKAAVRRHQAGLVSLFEKVASEQAERTHASLLPGPGP
jgi:hypothetical protein